MDSIPIVYALAVVIALGFMILGMFHGFCAARHRNPDAGYRVLVDLNPWNAAWFADQLDEVGLRHCRRAFRMEATSLAIWAATLASVAFRIFQGHD